MISMANRRISERKVILYTAALVLFAGIIRYLTYPVGSVMFYLAFVPFLVYRFYSTYKKRAEGSNSIDSYRMVVLVVMVITIVLNMAGWQEADFFLLFLLMVDFLLVINRKF